MTTFKLQFGYEGVVHTLWASEEEAASLAAIQLEEAGFENVLKSSLVRYGPGGLQKVQKLVECNRCGASAAWAQSKTKVYPAGHPREGQPKAYLSLGVLQDGELVAVSYIAHGSDAFPCNSMEVQVATEATPVVEDERLEDNRTLSDGPVETLTEDETLALVQVKNPKRAPRKAKPKLKA